MLRLYIAIIGLLFIGPSILAQGQFLLKDEGGLGAGFNFARVLDGPNNALYGGTFVITLPIGLDIGLQAMTGQRSDHVAGAISLLTRSKKRSSLPNLMTEVSIGISNTGRGQAYFGGMSAYLAVPVSYRSTLMPQLGLSLARLRGAEEIAVSGGISLFHRSIVIAKHITLRIAYGFNSEISSYMIVVGASTPFSSKDRRR